MRIRYEVVLLICLAMSAGSGAQPQKLTANPVPVKKRATLRVPKIPWLSLSAATYTAAAFDMHATANAVELGQKYPRFIWEIPKQIHS